MPGRTILGPTIPGRTVPGRTAVARVALGAFVLVVAACGSQRPSATVVSTQQAGSSRESGAPTSSGGSQETSPGSSPVGTAKPGSPPTAPTPQPGVLEWRSCGADLQCSTLTVPLDYDDPSKGTLDLYLSRKPARSRSRRIGSLLVNPGGPGVPGSYMAASAEGYFSPTILDRFDVVGWDPRGTGRSGGVVCVDNIDEMLTLDPTPDTAAEHQAAIDEGRQFARACDTAAGKRLPYISSVDSAKDMDSIRRALGEDTISYFGFSYGSRLGAVWATLFPKTVRAAVLDGAEDANASIEEFYRQQTVALERSLDAALAACGADPSCAFYGGGDPGAAFDALMASLDASPLPAKGMTPSTVGQGAAYIAVVSTLYDHTYWPELYKALAAGVKGDGRPLAALYVSYKTFQGLFPQAYQATYAINCVDWDVPKDIAEIDRFTDELSRLAPRLGAASGLGYACVDWPAPVHKVTVTARGAGPIVVVGTTGDPITPLESSRKMAASLEQGVLLTVEGEKHTGYGVNDCSQTTVDDYLVDLTVPQTGTICR